jgi:5-(carboxyamino)imidazole ribonucleotide mutase
MMAVDDNDQGIEDDKGPTEKLRDQAKPEAEQLTSGIQVPGAQDPESEEIKDEKGPNTE